MYVGNIHAYEKYIYVDVDGRKGECDGLMVCLIIFMLSDQIIYLVDCV